MKDEEWIAAATKHKWALRAELWIKEWETIPKWLLNELAKANIWDTVRWFKVTDKLHKQVVLAQSLSRMKK